MLPVSDNPAYKLHKVETQQKENIQSQLDFDKLFADSEDIVEVFMKHAKDEPDTEDGYEPVECYL